MNTKQIIGITLKKTSDELEAPGDYCITKNLGSIKSDQIIKGVVMLCPFCGMALATMPFHKIKKPWFSFLSKILLKLNIAHGVTVTPMIQCPYNLAHKFEIKRGRFYEIKNGN